MQRAGSTPGGRFRHPSRCHDEVPALVELEPRHRVSCHFAREIAAGTITMSEAAHDRTATATPA